MSKYKVIADLGLQVFSEPLPNAMLVDADELLKVLSGGVKVSGCVKYGKVVMVTEDAFTGDTHEGLLINWKPIKPPQVTYAEIEKALSRGPADVSDAIDVLNRIRKHGVANDGK